MFSSSITNQFTGSLFFLKIPSVINFGLSLIFVSVLGYSLFDIGLERISVVGVIVFGGLLVLSAFSLSTKSSERLESTIPNLLSVFESFIWLIFGITMFHIVADGYSTNKLTVYVGIVFGSLASFGNIFGLICFGLLSSKKRLALINKAVQQLRDGEQ